MNSRFIISACLTLLLLSNSALAQWSTIKGKFTVQGAVPVLPALACNGAVPCCAKPLSDESVVVSAKNELANVFVYALEVKDIHPNYKLNIKPLELTNLGCLFVPHAAILWTEQDLELVNKDPTGHNMNFASPTQGFNDLVAANSTSKRKISKNEIRPKPISCNIHPWMKANLLIRENPYFAVSAADGTFEIKDLPNNVVIEFQIWHERSGNLKGLKLPMGAVNDKGRFTLNLAADTDLGEIKVDGNVLK